MGINRWTVDTSTYTGSWRVYDIDKANQTVTLISDKNVYDLTLHNQSTLASGIQVLDNIAEAYVNENLAIAGKSIGDGWNCSLNLLDFSNKLPGPNIPDFLETYISRPTFESYKQLQISELTSSDGDYWYTSLASSTASDFSGSIEEYTGILYVKLNGEIVTTIDSTNYVYAAMADWSYTKNQSITKGVRPVITLKADILATAGDGNNESTAWQIK